MNDHRNDRRYGDAERLKLGMSWSNYDAFCRRRAEKSAAKKKKMSAPVAGLDYYDAAGNYVGGKRIPGSAPDDLI